MKQEERNKLTEDVHFRVEYDGRKEILEFAKGFGLSEGAAWRLLAARGLGDKCPECWKKSFFKLLGYIE